MRPWGEHLAAEGFAVRCPLLPGHGTRWQDCNTSTHDQWTTAVGEAFDALAAECDHVFVAGLSMGGTLAIRLAEERADDVAGLVLVNPALLTQRLDAKLLPLIARLTGSWAPIASDIKKPGVTELAYPKLPTRAMMQLAAAVGRHPRRPGRGHHAGDGLPQRRGPRRRADQHARCCWTASPAPTPPRSCCEDSYHVATLDNDAPAIFAGSVDWIRAHVPAAAARRRAPRRRRRDRPPGTAGQRPGRRRSGARCATSTPGSASTCSTCCTPSASPPTWSRPPTSSPYTRSVSLPSPPSDRLFVDRARRAEARTRGRRARPGRRRGAAAGARRAPAPARRPERPSSAATSTRTPSGRRIVAAFEAENGRNVVEDAAAARSRRPPVPHEVPILDRPDEHFEPPPPPPLPVPAPASLYAVLLVAVGAAARRRARRAAAVRPTSG